MSWLKKIWTTIKNWFNLRNKELQEIAQNLESSQELATWAYIGRLKYLKTKQNINLKIYTDFLDKRVSEAVKVRKYLQELAKEIKKLEKELDKYE